jgi:hypothetical protein
MSRVDLNELERRLWAAAAAGLRRAAGGDPGLRRFRELLDGREKEKDAPQNGTSSSDSAEPGEADADR